VEIRDPRPVADRERYVYGADLRGLARRESVQDYHPMAAAARSSRRPRLHARDYGERELRAAGGAAFEKIRQAGRGMPAVFIRQLEALAKIVEQTTSTEQRGILLEQAELVLEASDQSVSQASDRADVQRAYDNVMSSAARTALLRAA